MARSDLPGRMMKANHLHMTETEKVLHYIRCPINHNGLEEVVCVTQSIALMSFAATLF